MSEPRSQLPRFLHEDSLAIVRNLVVIAWIGVIAGAATEIWIRGFTNHEWPLLGGFSDTYNAILMEFTLNTIMLTLLLVRRDWYERVPRESAYRLRWLMVAVLAWEGLHLFGVFHVTGSLQGPFLPLLPVVVAGALMVLPGWHGWLLAAYLLAGHLAVVLLENTGLVHPRGPLADAFAYARQGTALGMLALSGVLASAVALALVARRDRYPGDFGLLSVSRRIDQDTGLFRRDFLDQRMNAELGRMRRRADQVALLLLTWETQAPGDMVAADLRRAANLLIGLLRLESDTPACYRPGTLAILLPATGPDGVRALMQRITAAFAWSGLNEHLRAAAAVTAAHGVDPASLMKAAEEALQHARPDGKVNVAVVGEKP